MSCIPRRETGAGAGLGSAFESQETNKNRSNITTDPGGGDQQQGNGLGGGGHRSSASGYRNESDHHVFVGHDTWSNNSSSNSSLTSRRRSRTSRRSANGAGGLLISSSTGPNLIYPSYIFSSYKLGQTAALLPSALASRHSLVPSLLSSCLSSVPSRRNLYAEWVLKIERASRYDTSNDTNTDNWGRLEAARAQERERAKKGKHPSTFDYRQRRTLVLTQSKKRRLPEQHTDTSASMMESRTRADPEAYESLPPALRRKVSLIIYFNFCFFPFSQLHPGMREPQFHQRGPGTQSWPTAWSK